MRRRVACYLIVLILICPLQTMASIFGDVRGVVRDPRQQVIAGAAVTLRSRTSDFSQRAQTSDRGEFFFRAIPLGEYLLTIEAKGFHAIEQPVTVISGSAPTVEIQLEVAPLSQQINVTANPEQVAAESITPTTLVNREQIARTPGAARSNSLAMISNYVPGAYTTHDQLHIRGGHQVTWLVDGVPVANTNIASNVGLQFDPKDIDYLEVQRGGYSAEYGDRTYGIFNIVPRTGFERHREAELVLSYGNYHQTNDQINFGSHSKRFAYYASVNGNHSDFGLQTPTAEVLHDEAHGLGGFASLVYDATPRDQLRLVGALRGDHYEVPNDPEAQAAGQRDTERERDAFVNFSWVHTINSRLLLTVSPFYHFNRADFIGGSTDTPVIPQERRRSQYAGAQLTFSALTRRHAAKAGFYGFDQRDDHFFGLQTTDGERPPLAERIKPSGHQEVVFAEDQYKPADWLTLTGGLRFTHFAGALTENVASPRLGAAVRLPRLNWVLRGFYGRYYQAPPLATVSGPLLELIADEGFAFLPLHGERDEEQQFGLAVPFKGWLVDGGYFRTHVKNFFDHSAIGESNIFVPLTIDRVRIRGVELTVHTPSAFKHGHAYLTYSHQRIEGRGAATGGLTDFEPGDETFFLDHDQRHTLNVGGDVVLPRRSYVAASVHYGSGFLNGEGLDHLPGHTTFDLSAGKTFSESWSVAVHAVNVADHRFLLDNSETFGGRHFMEPRQVYVELRYRFHY